MRDEAHSLAVPNIMCRALLQRGTWHWAWDRLPFPTLLQLWRPREEKAGVGVEAGELGLSTVCPYRTASISLLASSEESVCFV